MDMKKIWGLLHMVPKNTQANVASPSQASSSCGSSALALLPIHTKQISDHVYEISNLSGKRPALELIFFHGLQLEGSRQPHLDTWLSRDGSQLWLLWILEHFPDARILTISYDAHERETDKSGRNDMHVINENVLYDLLNESEIGQDGCPVVLVGHCVGGLVMKQLCVYASSKLDPTSSTDRTPVRNFLGNIKGLFFYATPHHGTNLADMETSYVKGPLFQYVTTLNTELARRNEDFCALRKNHGWKTFGIGENNRITRVNFQALLVPEASARHDMDQFYTIDADHNDVCKPESTDSSSFKKLLSFIEDIVEKEQVHIHECEGLPEYPMELEIRAWDVRRKVAGGAILGLFGMGGVGKTTLAKMVFNIMSKDFEYTCFLDNVKGKHVGSLKETLLGEFYHKGKKPESTLSQWSQLKDKKTLVVMDDVDSEEQLKVLPHLKDFKQGSCLIMTSRNNEIFKFYANCIVYQVELLKPEEAEELFCKHAFGQDPIPNNLKEHVKEIVRKCDGLPLTLEVMGRYLQGRTREVEVWKEILNNLGNATPIHGNDRVWHVLKVSYDGLSKEEQHIFLEAALIFFEKPLDFALAAWGNAKTTWENLVSRSLVKQITKKMNVQRYGEPEEQKEVWIHEQLRDLAKSMAGNDMVRVGRGGGLNDLETNEMKTTIQSLRLYYRYQRPTLRLDSFLRLTHLKYLEVVGVDIESRGKSLLRRWPWNLIPHDHWNHPERIGCSIGCDTFLEEALTNLWFSPVKMDNLVVLELSDCEIPKVLVEALGNLANLRILTLSHLKGFECLPENFGNLLQLRILNLENLPLLVLPKSFGNLRTLEHLLLRGMGFLELPESFGYLSSLRTLRISHCDTLASLPDSFGPNLTSLKELFIVRCGIECLPRYFSKLVRLEQLHIEECHRLNEIGDSFGDLVLLRKLTLGARRLRRLPASFGHFPSLEECKLDCLLLLSLPDDFCHLTALKELEIVNYCLRALPKNFGQLSSLEKCTLRCSGLKSLSDDFGDLSALKKLHIECEALETLPENFGQLSSLEKCTLGCRGLKSLSDDFGDLSALKKLHIECEALETLPENFGSLESLEDLCLRRLQVLKRLPDNLGLMISLRDVRLEYCQNLESVPDSLGKPSSSQSRLLQGCEIDELKTRAGECSQTASTDGIRLFVHRCPYLSDSIPGSLSSGSVQSDHHGGVEHFNRNAQVVHHGVTCAFCRMSPLQGSRYKSSKRFDFNLCSRCFQELGCYHDDFTCFYE